MPRNRAIAVFGIFLNLAVTGCSPASPDPTSPSPQRTGEPNSGMDVHASMSEREELQEPSEELASPPAATIPPGARVPDLRGMEFEDAVIALRELGMDFGLVLARTSQEELWVVVEQVPGPGARPSEDGRVAMILSMGSHAGGVGGIRPIRCEPEEDDIDEPYCLGKLLRY